MPLPQAILFDMDGTLTEPLLDFAAIRREIGIAPGAGILESISRMNPADRTRAEAILHRHEDEAARNSTLNPGCRELLGWLIEREMKLAIVTRNSRRCAEIIFEQHAFDFKVCITREDAVFKPDPAPIRLACNRLNVDCANAWMVGDGEYDITAGAAAGCATVWLSHGRNRHFQVEPWQTVTALPELHNFLRCHVS